MKWQHVTRAFRCPVCSKPDWCSVGERWINCMRIISDKPCKNGGWLHPVGSGPRQPIESRPEPVVVKDFSGLIAGWSANGLLAFASTLGVKSEALQSLGCVWADTYRAWAFPMRSGDGSVIGIRLRNDAGHKWAVKGSKQGLFIPAHLLDELVDAR